MRPSRQTRCRRISRARPAAAIAHGKRDDAEKLARRARRVGSGGRGRPRAAGDRARQVQAKRRRCSSRSSRGNRPARLRSSWRCCIARSAARGDAQPLLTAVFRQGQRSSDPNVALPRRPRGARAQPPARRQHLLSRRADAPAAIRAMVETAWGRLFLEKYNSARSAEVVRGGARGRPAVGAGAMPASRACSRTRIRPRPPPRPTQGARDRCRSRRRAPAARVAAPRRRPRQGGARRDRQGPRVQPVAPRGPRDARGDGLRQGRQGRPSTAKSRRCSRSIRPTARSTASPGSTPRAITASTKRRRSPRRRWRSIRRTAAPPAISACTCCARATSRARAARSSARGSADPFDVVTFNLLKMLDNLEQFVTVKEGDIVLKMHRDEAPVLREYAMPLAQEALKTLSAQVRLHADRARSWSRSFRTTTTSRCATSGCPGMIGALGACFGRVVTMDSPTARARPRHLQLAGDAVARDGARRHAADVEAADPALADRGDFGPRGSEAARPSGAATWK